MKIKNHIGVFADKDVGGKTLDFLLNNYFNDIKWIVCNDEKSMAFTILIKYNFNLDFVFLNSQLDDDSVLTKLRNSEVDYILLAWWPYIIREPILSIPSIGVLNFHPSLLPYNRGRHYNFWTIIENTPFGVSIHFINKKIDSGDVIFQKRISKDWTDTGETLYFKAQEAMFNLFEEKYCDIREGKYIRNRQDPQLGTLHFAKELDQASKIYLDKSYKGRELLNILRARTFIPHPAAWFEEDGKKYEVRIKISKTEEK